MGWYEHLVVSGRSGEKGGEKKKGCAGVSRSR